jgi:uncharacterized RDD family membrane protein YckC
MEYTMSPATPSVEASAISYAGFWRRFWAAMIDGLILSAFSAVIILLFVVGLLGIGSTGVASFDNPDTTRTADGAIVLMWFLCTAIFVAGGWLYYAFMESSKNQGTLGKMALGLRVTDLDGKRISFARATGRYFAKILSNMTLWIGYIMAGFTSKKQALHDFVAGTLVLSKQSTVPAQVAQNAFSGS